MTDPEIPAVRISSPSDLIAVTPLLLGFIPHNSVVIICLHEARGRVGLILRYDLELDEDVDPTELALEANKRIAIEDAGCAFVVIFSDFTPSDGRLPHERLAAALDFWVDVPIVDTLFVHDGSWWSYDDPDLPGVPVDDSSPAATTVSAANALNGRGVLPDREAVIDSLSLALDDTERRRSRIRIQRRLDRNSTVAQWTRRIAVRGLVDGMAEKLRDPRGTLVNAEVAELVALLHDVVVRDEVLVRAAEAERRRALLPVLQEVLRRTPPPYDPPVASSLAWIAYANGDGITANVALERALATDPDYPFAGLVRDALYRQLSPAAVEQVMRDAGQEMSLDGWDASA